VDLVAELTLTKFEAKPAFRRRRCDRGGLSLLRYYEGDWNNEVRLCEAAVVLMVM